MTEIKPEQNDLDRVRTELGESGHYGWLIIKKLEKDKAILKAELHFVTTEKDELTHKIILQFKPEESFKETYLVGAYYENGEGFMKSVLEKLKDANILGNANSLMNLVSQGQT